MKKTRPSNPGHWQECTLISRRKLVLNAGAAAVLTSFPSRAATVDSAFGTIEVPATPVQIVTLDSAGAIAVNHGLVPVGTTALDSAWLTEAGRQLAANVPVIGQTTYDGQLRFEKILRLEPDLIVGMIRGSGDYSAVYRKLSAIAPTVLLQANGAGTLLDVTFSLAQAMEIGAAAETEKMRYEVRCKAMRTRWRNGLTRAPFAVLSGQDRQIVVYARNSWTGRILSDLGASLPPVTQGAERNGVSLSYEQIDALAEAGAILYPIVNGKPAPEVAGFWDMPGFRSLSAVREDRLHGVVDLWPETHLAALNFLDAIEVLLERTESERRRD